MKKIILFMAIGLVLVASSIAQVLSDRNDAQQKYDDIKNADLVRGNLKYSSGDSFINSNGIHMIPICYNTTYSIDDRKFPIEMCDNFHDDATEQEILERIELEAFEMAQSMRDNIKIEYPTKDNIAGIIDKGDSHLTTTSTSTSTTSSVISTIASTISTTTSTTSTSTSTSTSVKSTTSVAVNGTGG